MHHRAKFHQDRFNCSRDMAIFRFIKIGGRRHLGFLKFEILIICTFFDFASLPYLAYIVSEWISWTLWFSIFRLTGKNRRFCISDDKIIGHYRKQHFGKTGGVFRSQAACK